MNSEKVRKFHELISAGAGGTNDGKPLPEEMLQLEALENALSEMQICSGSLEQIVKHHGLKADPRILRIQLIIEECAELCEAIALGDEVEALDGACDLIYVTVGTAVAFDWHIEEAFEEVCDSNLTKQPKAIRVRDKGDTYQPPRLAAILEKHRAII